MPILFYDRIALMHSPLTRRHQFANKIEYFIRDTNTIIKTEISFDVLF